MKKAALLILGFIGSAFVYPEKSANLKIKDNLIITALVAAPIVTYCYLRESNELKIKKAEAVFDLVCKDLHFCTLDEAQQFVKHYEHLRKDIHEAFTALDNRYGSFFKPWNWTAEMKLAHQKIEILELLFRYSQFLRTSNLQQGGVVDFVLSKNKKFLMYRLIMAILLTSYPLHDEVDFIRFHIGSLVKPVFNFGFEENLADFYKDIFNAIFSSKAYTSEARDRFLEGTGQFKVFRL